MHHKLVSEKSVCLGVRNELLYAWAGRVDLWQHIFVKFLSLFFKLGPGQITKIVVGLSNEFL